MDFVSDQLANGRRFRVLKIVDDYTRECVLQVVDFSISGERLARELDRLAGKRTLPKTIVCDNGPGLTGKAMFLWSQRSGVKLHFIQPGKPTRMLLLKASTVSSASTAWISIGLPVLRMRDQRSMAGEHITTMSGHIVRSGYRC